MENNNPTFGIHVGSKLIFCFLAINPPQLQNEFPIYSLTINVEWCYEGSSYEAPFLQRYAITLGGFQNCPILNELKGDWKWNGSFGVPIIRSLALHRNLVLHNQRPSKLFPIHTSLWCWCPCGQFNFANQTSPHKSAFQFWSPPSLPHTKFSIRIWMWKIFDYQVLFGYGHQRQTAHVQVENEVADSGPGLSVSQNVSQPIQVPHHQWN